MSMAYWRNVLTLGTLLCAVAPALARDGGPIVVDLKLDPTFLDWEGNKKAMQMYMPSSAKLVAERPESVKVEPTYSGKPRYGVIPLGNGLPRTFAFALDEADGKDAKIYIDRNGDGDLTNDGTGDWPKKTDGDSGANYQGTFVFDVRWIDDKGQTSTGPYGLNIYWSTGRESVNWYRAGAGVGTVDIGGKSYAVTVIENDNDALFDKLYDGSGAEVKSKPLYLLLDGNSFDIRATFGFNDTNYVAKVARNGTRLELTPTSRFIRLPRPLPKATETELLKAGAEAPDFNVLVWKGAGTEPAQLSLASFRGKKIVVVDFWATWCGPCMRGLPHFAKVAAAAKGQDVEFLAVNSMDDAAAYETFVSGKGKDLAITFARDPAGKTSDASIARRLYNVRGIPAQFVIGKDGKVLAAISGYQEGDKALENTLKKAGIKLE
ncbi:MAG: TlpA family protein disulfide reductase [Phycisphaerales bacterium]|nr:TlpA family protein disulfide reductase [Phycisphaerales bacterium]